VTTRIRKTAEDRKTEIVTVAIRLAAEFGPDRVTTNMLAAEIGISQPAIFRHFPTKSTIWTAVGAHIGKFMETGGQLPLSTGSPAEVLLDQVIKHLGFIQITPALPAILFSRELHAENEELRQHFAAMMANRQAVFADLIAQAVHTGEFSKGLDVEDAAYLVLALIQGLAMRWLLNGREFDLALEGGRLMKIQIAGFRTIQQG
jgi:AcrR family transcriptional regulator